MHFKKELRKEIMFFVLEITWNTLIFQLLCGFEKGIDEKYKYTYPL